MINLKEISQNKNTPIALLFAIGAFLFISILLAVTAYNYNDKLSKSKLIELEIKLQNARLLQEKKALESQINKYIDFSDSINSVIENNKKISNEKIKTLIQLTNDELRKIAND